ncbi:GntR family transcriptional regulator [Sphaerisporangium sp. NPDC051011]|uniref:GntR family transcriptional regulator n=1 Tax=Sphaerisporangium sp. NPDC051011 TaxID=3155792 RepID=UPI0033E61143
MTSSPSPELTVSRTSLREQCGQAIRALIVSGGLRPGEIHSIGSLAEKLGVSITPVREALLDLARDELIEMLRNRGFRVVALSDEDLDELMDLRLMLEVPAIERIAAARPTPDLSELRRVADEITQYAVDGDMANFVARDRDLHLGILERYGNRRLVQHVGLLRDQTRLYGLQKVAGSPEFLRSAAEHGELLDLIEAGRSREAADLMRCHLHHTRGLWSGRVEEAGR